LGKEMSEVRQKRIDRVLVAMKKQGVEHLLVSAPESVWYLTGYDNQPMERLMVFDLSLDGDHCFFLNRLFPVPESAHGKVWFSDTDDSIKLLANHLANCKVIGVDKDWPARFLLSLMELLPETRFVLASDCVDDVRACKDEVEQELMREVSRINDAVMERVAGHIEEGMTEREIADFVLGQYDAEGCGGVSFPPIVSFGANAADPHHEPDETRLKVGDCIVVDIGCRKNRYCSDMTRTFFCKKAEAKYVVLHDLVREANEKAEQLVKPGVCLCELDKAARDHIAQAGYGEYFTHRLGHFIGQTDHEKGDVSAASRIIAAPGMIFSIEPGVYLPGEFGVRVEDLVMVTEDGCEILNRVKKEYQIIG